MAARRLLAFHYGGLMLCGWKDFLRHARSASLSDTSVSKVPKTIVGMKLNIDDEALVEPLGA